MTAFDDSFDVDAALGGLRRRSFWLRVALAVVGAACLGLWAAVAVDGIRLLDHPLTPTITSVHLPGPVLYAGSPERVITASEKSLAMVCVVLFIGFAAAIKRAESHRRILFVAAGVGVLCMALVAQTVARIDSVSNTDLKNLAGAGEYAELLHRVKARSGMPYADYIGAQALVLSGRGSELNAQYGAWLKKWSLLAAEYGYALDTSSFSRITVWEGAWASPSVMRALELKAFGRAPTEFSVQYEAQVRTRLAATKHRLAWLAPLTGVATLVLLVMGLAWHQLRGNIVRAQTLSLRIDDDDARPPSEVSPASKTTAPVQKEAPVSLPPIEFTPH